MTEGLVEGFSPGSTARHAADSRSNSRNTGCVQAGDEPRYVDWKLLGRKDRLYVKQFEEETSLRAMVVLDSSRSMDWSGLPMLD